MEKHIITIAPNGKTTVKVEGVKGNSCTDLTEDLLKKLGETTSTTKTREYNEQLQTQDVQNRNRR